MGVADVGWGMLFARNTQEAADLALIARRAAEDSETPFMNIQDGFLTTHTLETVRLPELDLMREFIGAPAEHIRKLFDPTQPVMSGVVQNQDSYMKGKVAQRFFYDRVEPALRNAIEDYARLTGRHYPLIRTHRMEDAEYALVGFGTMMETAEATADWLREKGIRVGVVHVTSFRPFPARELADVLLGCRAISVIERADIPLAESNPLTAEVKAALADRAVELAAAATLPLVFSGVAGLGGRDVRPAHLVAADDNIKRPDGKRFFTLGIRHPAAIDSTEDPDVRPLAAYSMRGHSVGGFGSVTTNKVIASVASDLFHLNAQAFPKYGSEKKGLPTSYYLTLAPSPVRLHAELNLVDFVAIQDANAFAGGDPLIGLRPGGVIYFQTNLPLDQVWASLPLSARNAIRTRKLKLFALDALRIARESSRRTDLQIRMQGIALLGAFLRLTPFAREAELTEDRLFDSLRKTLEKYFGKRGGRVVDDNLAAARRGFNEVAEVTPPAQETGLEIAAPPARHVIPCADADGPVAPGFCDHIIEQYTRGRDADLDADLYIARSLMPPSSAALRSFRNLAPEIPQFLASNCVGCMECVNECPDTAILAKVIEPPELDRQLVGFDSPELRDSLRANFVATNKYHDLFVKRGETGGLFGIFIDADKCKGCGECVTVCGSHNALKMTPKSAVNLSHYDSGMALYKRAPETPARFLNEKSLGDMMLSSRSLLYAGGAGSCMGCGEATTVRLMLAATGFVYGADEIGIVAATGCNTVFGSTYPYNPFAVPWTNSLFENAPADALGVRLRWDQEGHTRRRLWVLGGDGAMYDIGFQALSRMLMTGRDIKVLILDTQVYSNTGGQSSTATFTGQDAKMAAFGSAQHGKRESRKEIGPILFMHSHVFVAQTTPAHLNHFYKSVMAANEFPGPAVIIAYASCMPEHGIPDDRASLQAKLAVESRTFPLFTFDPRKGDRISECLSLQGNPALKEDWFADPKTNSPVDFVSFARTEGRFARHFDAEGRPDEFLLRARQDRLENWRRLQELARLR
jgi:pyruvate/2-oxoacid:ferredoxin oxidoreductase beta subunit/Pyruvate/2-oxoacid:ferredoxin oxidoreductase gamma subunit/Pyruvate/2-oxoacid:ferredoxin oxidoreductase delta subunit